MLFDKKKKLVIGMIQQQKNIVGSKHSLTKTNSTASQKHQESNKDTDKKTKTFKTNNTMNYLLKK